MKKAPNTVHIDPSCQFIDSWPVSFSKKTPGSITYSIDTSENKTTDVTKYEEQITDLKNQVTTLSTQNEEMCVKLDEYQQEIEDLILLTTKESED